MAKSAPSGITSREYKLILNADRFADRSAGSDALRALVALQVERYGGTLENQDKEEIRRTFYLDTPALDLNRAGFILRVRFEEKDKLFKTTLKHRSPDRYLAAAQDLASGNGFENDHKFEEDILPPFTSKFSRSNKVEGKAAPKLDRFADLQDIFPGLRSLRLDDNTPLEKVNGFEAHEVFRTLCEIDFGGKRNVDLSLSFWYRTPDSRWPLIAECSFDYKANKDADKRAIPDDFPLDVVQGTNRFFSALQNQPGWIDCNTTTKTQFVYEALS